MDPLATSFLFQQFLTQRRYLKNVTPSTIEWYETAFKALQKTHGTDPQLTKTNLQAFVVALRQRDVQSSSKKSVSSFLSSYWDTGATPTLCSNMN